MRFDIKYAYFNFLQSIPHSPRKDPASCKVINLESSFSGSACNSGDESDITESLPNPNNVRDDSDGEMDELCYKPDCISGVSQLGIF